MAENPLEKQPEFEPLVTSLSAALPVEYRNGLRKPSGLLPAARSRSLRSATTEAKVGLAQLVPETASVRPSTTTSSCCRA